MGVGNKNLLVEYGEKDSGLKPSFFQRGNKTSSWLVLRPYAPTTLGRSPSCLKQQKHNKPFAAVQNWKGFHLKQIKVMALYHPLYSTIW